MQMLLPLNKYPKIDVHGETRDTIYSVINDFINDNIKLKNSVIVIIHGRGAGILKSEIHSILKKDRRVSKYYLHYWNQGVTVAELNA